jgi:hypothetical protein
LFLMIKRVLIAVQAVGRAVERALGKVASHG